jgi:hypothetical protein
MKTAGGGIQPTIAAGPGVEIEDYWLDIQSSSSLLRPNGSVEMLQHKDVIFENPSNGLLLLNDMVQISQVRILNQLGQSILEKVYGTKIENETLDITNQKNGVYFIEFSYQNGFKKIEKLLLKQ